MSLLDIVGLRRFPAQAKGATLVVADAPTLTHAADFLASLAQCFGPLAVAIVGEPGALRTGDESWPQLRLPTSGIARFHRALNAPRVIALGACAGRDDVLEGASGDCCWVNAQTPAAQRNGCRVVTVADARVHEILPHALLTGDPLTSLSELPGAQDSALCERFRDHHAGGRWVGYFAATGEEEEAIAYGTFFQLARRKMGLLVLAPADPARCEPVYREAIKYRLPTNRHNRLSTSFVPLKTRVYYVEEAAVLNGLYGCADFVVVGGTLNAAACNTPNVIAPLALGRPTIVGPAHHDALIDAAQRAGAVALAATPEAVVEIAADWVNNPDAAAQQGARGREWLQGQVGARERVLALLSGR